MRKTALLFPGQGAQYAGMGEKLCRQWPSARLTFEEAGDVTGMDIHGLCANGTLSEITATSNAQPAILTVSVAAYRVYTGEMEALPVPQYMAGHSLGEYSALVCAGAFSFADGLKLVRKRGLLMQEVQKNNQGAMLAVAGLDALLVEQVCRESAGEDQPAAIAAYNAPGQIVVSGHTRAVGRAQQSLARMGATLHPLPVGAAFHCSLMSPVAGQLRQELRKVAYGRMRCPVLSNATGTPYGSTAEIAEHLSEQITHPVLWHQGLSWLMARGVHYLLEMPPKKILTNMVKGLAQPVEAYAYERAADREALRGSVSDHIHAIPNVVTQCLLQAVCARNRNPNDEVYAQEVVAPLQKVKAIQEQLEQERRLPNRAEMNTSIAALEKSLRAKHVSAAELHYRLSAVLDAYAVAAGSEYAAGALSSQTA